MSFTVTVAAQTIAAPETLGNPNKGASILAATEDFVVLEFQRPRASKRAQIMVPRAQVLSVNHGTTDADSGYVIAQGVAGEADSFEAESFTVAGNIATFTTADGATVEADARLCRAYLHDTESQGSLVATPEKKGGKKDKGSKKK